MPNTVITGPILDSFGQPVNGYLYGAQTARSVIDGALVTQTVVKARVIDGTPFLDDGVTPLEVPATVVDAEAFEWVEDFRPYRGEVVRYTDIPDAGPVAYAALRERARPIGSSTWIVPGWARELVDANAGIAASVEHVDTVKADIDATVDGFGTTVSDAQEVIADAAAEVQAFAGTNNQQVANMVKTAGPLQTELNKSYAPIGSTGGVSLEDVAEAAGNPETDLNTIITGIAESVTPAGLPVIFTATSLSDARPATASGQAVWWRIVSTNPAARPIHMATNDFVFVIAAEPLDWTPSQDPNTLVWLDPAATGVADGVAVSPWPDQTTHAYSPTKWTVTSGQATSSPLLSMIGLNGTPCVVLPARSGFAKNTPVTPTVALIIGINWQAAAANAASQTIVQFTASQPGRYTFGRTADGSQWFVTNADATVTYPFGTADTLPHSVIVMHTPTVIKVWLDGVLALEQVVAIALQGITSFRLGYSEGSSVAETRRVFEGGKIGDYFVSTGAEIDATGVTARTKFLKKKRGVV